MRDLQVWRVWSLVFAIWLSGSGCKRTDTEKPGPELDPVTRQAQQLRNEQRQNDDILWSKEVRALAYANALHKTVDDFRDSRSRLSVLQRLTFGALRFRPPLGPTESLGGGVERHHFRGSLLSWSQQDWRQWVVNLSKMPVKLEYFSLKLLEFEPASDVIPRDKTLVELECHGRSFTGQGDAQKVVYHVWRGELALTWEPSAEPLGTGVINTITVMSMEWLQRSGAPMFEPKLRYAIGKADVKQAVRITPVVVTDLDGDHRQDILLAGQNVLLRNQGNFEFQDEPMLETPLSLRSVGAVADFNADGHLDFLGFLNSGESVLVQGKADGRFVDVPESERISPWKELAEYPSALAVADVDGDGDLDVWMAQFRPAYYRGALPDPFFDANDGFQSRLYRNDGQGVFEDVTQASGLGRRDRRRTTSSSFTDLDNDGYPDLLITSVWAGVEAYRNDGSGRFEVITETQFPDWNLLAEGHAIGRFDEDENWDVFVAGRWSLPVHRMNKLGLERADFPDFPALALEMASGNRVFYSKERGQGLHLYVQNTGWSKSVVAADFDNDDDDDLYVATGNITGSSVEDFDSQFWRHDVFLTEGVSLAARQRFFRTPSFATELARLKAGEISWGGYQPNRLFINDKWNFVDRSYLHGVALPQDSPAAVVADLDADGRQDILAIAEKTFVTNGRLAVEQSLAMYRNGSKSQGHWLGVNLDPNVPKFLRCGSQVRLFGSFGVRRKVLGPGASPMTQGPYDAHFGLGDHEVVERLEVQWGNGWTQTVIKPEIDQYLAIRPRLDFKPIPEPPVREPEPEEDSSGA